MSFVLDSSVTLAWFFDDERTPETDALLDRAAETDVVVPALWMYEFINRLARARARDSATADRVAEFVARLGALVLEMASPSPIRVAELAAETGLTAYDAAYLELAHARGLPLATLDTRLREAAAKAGVELLPASLD